MGNITQIKVRGVVYDVKDPNALSLADTEQLLSERMYIDGDTLYLGDNSAPSGYISEGLVFHLDGINKGENNGEWTDLIGGIRYSNTNCVFRENHIEFPSDSLGYLSTESPLAFHAETHTIEIVYDGVLTGQHRFLFHANLSSGIMADYASSNIFVLSANVARKTYTPITTTGVSRLSMNVDRAVQNLEELVSPGNNYFDASSLGYIGRRDGSTESQKFVGKMYSVRIYSRKLTKAEMFQNQLYDAIRFNL